MTTLLDSPPCTRCHGTIVEPLDNGTAACCYCGMRTKLGRAQAEKAAAAAPKGEEFRFQYGRFVGMTIPEAAAQPNGRRYLEALAKTNDRMRARIEDFFALDEWTDPAQIV